MSLHIYSVKLGQAQSLEPFHLERCVNSQTVGICVIDWDVFQVSHMALEMNSFLLLVLMTLVVTHSAIRLDIIIYIYFASHI